VGGSLAFVNATAALATAAAMTPRRLSIVRNRPRDPPRLVWFPCTMFSIPQQFSVRRFHRCASLPRPGYKPDNAPRHSSPVAHGSRAAQASRLRSPEIGLPITRLRRHTRNGACILVLALRDSVGCRLDLVRDTNLGALP